jgi:hypothetical protein
VRIPKFMGIPFGKVERVSKRSVDINEGLDDGIRAWTTTKSRSRWLARIERPFWTTFDFTPHAIFFLRGVVATLARGGLIGHPRARSRRPSRPSSGEKRCKD